jgi:endo-1,4-beta-xylanase
MWSSTRRASKQGVALVLCVLALTVGAATPAYADDGSYAKSTNGASGKCIDADYNNTNDGATVQMWDCWTPGTNQEWGAQNCDWAMKCEIVNLWSGKCLDADSGHITSNGDTVQLWTCWGGSNQEWYVGLPDFNGRFQVINAASGKCLDADANNLNNGARVQLWDCWFINIGPLRIPAPNQTWIASDILIPA